MTDEQTNGATEKIYDEDPSMGLWVITPLGREMRLLGRVSCSNDATPDDVRMAEVQAWPILTLDPVYDFVVVTRELQKPTGEILRMREPVIAYHDFVLRGAPVHLFRQSLISLEFLDEFHPDDKRFYQDMVRSAQVKAREQRAAQSNIALPNQDNLKAILDAGRRPR